MKSILHSFPLLATLFLWCSTCHSQFLSENFNTGIPASWTQSATATWSLSNLGTSGSGCIVTEENTTNTVIVSIFTPSMDLSAVTNLTISFQGAVVKNNFVCPNIVLYSETGSGRQFLSRWGSGFTSNTTHTISEGFDSQPPLESSAIFWETCTHTLSAINGNVVRFILEAEFVNGGYVLLDDITVNGVAATTTSLFSAAPHIHVNLFPNPTATKKITLDGTDYTAIYVFDNAGKIVSPEYHKRETSTDVMLTDFPAGTYYLKAVTTKKTSITKKLVVE
ncbi:hypothetical protein CNR22_07810 [Sphingobacteriaceae bacterium]|nr:hypothetical protein CNR22_07810 [Sphingobacteriaceae bacterium]